MSQDLVELLGVDFENPGLLGFIPSLNEMPTMQRVGDRLYLSLRGAGVLFDADLEGRVEQISLYAEDCDGYRQFGGSLPKDINFGDPRDEVRAKLGSPSESAEPTRGPYGEPLHAWDAWDQDNHRLHIQYGVDNTVELVSVIRPDAIVK